MNIHFITYATSEFSNLQNRLHDNPYTSNFIHHKMTEKDISDEFRKENDYILSKKRGGGYWLWKSYFIDKILNEVDDGDIVFYMDCGDDIISDIENYLLTKHENHDSLLYTSGHSNMIWCKRKCFEIMDCFEFQHSHQLEAGILSFKKTESSLKLVKDWLTLCKNPDLITDDGIGNEVQGFRDHRHDQAILTNLTLKQGIPTQSIFEIYNFININANTI